MHEQACLVNPPRASAEPLVVNTAGNCCVGWTAEGKRARHSHESQHPFYVWLCQRRELALREQEDLFLQECTPQFDILSCMISPLQDSHLVVHAVIGPRMLGWPTSRDRRLSCGLNLKSLVWLGPSSTQEIQQDFERFFRRRCCLTGDVFFQSDPDATRAWVKSVMQKRARITRSAAIPASGQDMCQLVLSPGQLQRLEKYRGLWKECSSMSGSFIADLDHWPDAGGPLHGPAFPVMLRHGTTIDLQTLRIAQMADRCLALGLHMKESGSTRYAWPMRDYMLTLKDRAGKSMTGNSQSIPAICAWYLYVLSHTCRREKFLPYKAPSNEFLDPEDDA